MTNTRMTDVETMERNYPVLVRQFSLREGSGGAGEYHGGDGVIRDLQFLTPEMQVSILSERRVFHPYGLKGGHDAQCGRNTWIKNEKDEDGNVIQKVVNLGGKVSARGHACIS